MASVRHSDMNRLALFSLITALSGIGITAVSLLIAYGHAQRTPTAARAVQTLTPPRITLTVAGSHLAGSPPNTPTSMPSPSRSPTLSASRPPPRAPSSTLPSPLLPSGLVVNASQQPIIVVFQTPGGGKSDTSVPAVIGAISGGVTTIIAAVTGLVWTFRRRHTADTEPPALPGGR